ncbi:cytochrome P450 1A1-like [Halichondria panicea]|uniref:cytochrome P450 1A1-like n=1 Tax=Halichondria panicea TaxID=6063 RepID=UPI00312B6EE8
MVMEELADAWSWIFTILVGLIAAVLIKTKWSSRNEPPGPWGLPVLGYLPFLGQKRNLTFSNLSKKYGEIFQLKIGSRKVVVISGEKAIREALLDRGTTFAGRPDFYSYAKNDTFAFYDFTPKYRACRKNTMKSLNEFFKSQQTEFQGIAQNAATMFMREVKNFNGQPFNPEPLLFRVTCTIIGYVCFHKQFDANDKDVTAILELGKQFGNFIIFGVICDYLPWAKVLLKTKLKKFEAFSKELADYSDKIFQIQSEEGTGNSMIDIFNRVCEKTTDNETTSFKFDEPTVRKQVSSLFGAGFATTAVTLKYSLMMMALYPDVQRKLHEELDRVVGKNRYPEFADKDDLPYTMAVMSEINRHHSMSALSLTHTTTCDTEFHGYSLAKHTPVIFNYYSINRGDDVFKNADKFDPERFLKEDGSFDAALASRVTLFGLGRRRCAGEELGRFQLFLFFATLLQQCTIEESPAHPLDTEDYYITFGITHGPIKVVVHSRIEDIVQ